MKGGMVTVNVVSNHIDSTVKKTPGAGCLQEIEISRPPRFCNLIFIQQMFLSQVVGATKMAKYPKILHHLNTYVNNLSL